MSDASESHAALVDEVASLKAKIERLESKTGIPHHVACNYPQGPMGGPGCICVVANKHEITEREAENERLQKENANHRRKWHKWQHLLATGSLASIIERADEAEARAAKLAVALEEAAEEEERESWNCVQSSDAFVREKTFAEWQAVHPSDIRETLKG